MQKKHFQVKRPVDGHDFENMKTLTSRLMHRVQSMADHPDGIAGLPCGFGDLDLMTAGFQPGELIVLGARPAMGKTGLALNMAEHVALQLGLPVALFSLSMGATQLVAHLAGSMARIEHTHFSNGRLTDDEWPHLTQAIEALRNAPLHIADSGHWTAAELRTSALRLAQQCGQLGLVVVDYLQLLREGGGPELKSLALELNCPVLALSQVTRNVEQRPNKRPLLSDLPGSGEIENAADTILFLYRDEYYTKDACKEPGVAEIIVARQRDGPIGMVKLKFLRRFGNFENLVMGG